MALSAPQAQPRGTGGVGCAVTIRINRTLGTVDGRRVRRVFRNPIGDWCAEVDMGGGEIHIAVFDHHPNIPSLRILQNDGVDIAEDVIAQGAEVSTCAGGQRYRLTREGE